MKVIGVLFEAVPARLKTSNPSGTPPRDGKFRGWEAMSGDDLCAVSNDVCDKLTGIAKRHACANDAITGTLRPDLQVGQI